MPLSIPEPALSTSLEQERRWGERAGSVGNNKKCVELVFKRKLAKLPMHLGSRLGGPGVTGWTKRVRGLLRNPRR